MSSQSTSLCAGTIDEQFMLYSARPDQVDTSCCHGDQVQHHHSMSHCHIPLLGDDVSSVTKMSPHASANNVSSHCHLGPVTPSLICQHTCHQCVTWCVSRPPSSTRCIALCDFPVHMVTMFLVNILTVPAVIMHLQNLSPEVGGRERGWVGSLPRCPPQHSLPSTELCAASTGRTAVQVPNNLGQQ